MINFTQEPPQTQISSNQTDHLASADFSLSLATLPFLWGMATFNHLHDNLIHLGKMSEEIFRGDRLPLLEIEDITIKN
jgi:hypothetical protein